VVRQGSRVAERLRVQFRSLPGESFDARPLDHFDPALDLAVLVVSEVGRHNIPLDRIPFERLGAPEALKRGDPVYPLGNPGGRSWYSRVNPDAMSAAVTGDRLVFEAPFLARGHSGGGLFTERWELVGMIQADEPPEGRALSVTRMIAEWSSPPWPS
jgi:S1-C subfamily serine protease